MHSSRPQFIMSHKTVTVRLANHFDVIYNEKLSVGLSVCPSVCVSVCHIFALHKISNIFESGEKVEKRSFWLYVPAVTSWQYIFEWPMGYPFQKYLLSFYAIKINAPGSQSSIVILLFPDLRFFIDFTIFQR